VALARVLAALGREEHARDPLDRAAAAASGIGAQRLSDIARTLANGLTGAAAAPPPVRPLHGVSPVASTLTSRELEVLALVLQPGARSDRPRSRKL